jgi:hypothetical protein
MNDAAEMFFRSDYGPTLMGGASSVFFILVLSFLIGHFIGFIYMWTHEALSYSRTYVASLAVLPMVIAILVIIALTSGMVVTIGLLAVFGVIRFRNVLKDTRDTVFILWTVMEGLAVGSMHYSTALLGTVCVGGVLLYLRLCSFGTRNRYDAVVTLRLTGDPIAAGANLRRVLHLHASTSTLASERRVTDGGVDVTYRLLLRDPSRFDELQASLSQTEGLANVSVFMHDDEAEI